MQCSFAQQHPTSALTGLHHQSQLGSGARAWTGPRATPTRTAARRRRAPSARCRPRARARRAGTPPAGRARRAPGARRTGCSCRAPAAPPPPAAAPRSARSAPACPLGGAQGGERVRGVTSRTKMMHTAGDGAGHLFRELNQRSCLGVRCAGEHATCMHGQHPSLFFSKTRRQPLWQQRQGANSNAGRGWANGACCVATGRMAAPVPGQVQRHSMA